MNHENDRLILREIAVDTVIGLLPEERLGPQRLLIDLDLATDFSEAIACDDSSGVLDYARVVAEVRSFAEARRDGTLEKFAHFLAEHLRTVFPRITQATITVFKPHYTTGLRIGSVAVQLTR